MNKKIKYLTIFNLFLFNSYNVNAADNIIFYTNNYVENKLFDKEIINKDLKKQIEKSLQISLKKYELNKLIISESTNIQSLKEIYLLNNIKNKNNDDELINFYKINASINNEINYNVSLISSKMNKCFKINEMINILENKNN